MARYKRKQQFDSSEPGLFDDFGGTPFGATAEGMPDVAPLFPTPDDSLPIHSAIDKAASQFRIEERRRLAPRPETIFSNDDLTPLEAPSPIDKLNFISFGSGSSGNCAYIGDGHTGILIDAGVEATFVETELRRYGIGMSQISGIILTHDHSDHVRYVYSLVRKRQHIAIYCTPKVLNGILRRHNISRRVRDYHHPIYKEHPFRIGAFEIVAFEVPHDGTDNAGFFITHGRHHLAVATDLGSVSERADFYLRQANYMMLEANYDEAMLACGSYPEYLKARIRSANGHLCNDDTAAYLAAIASPGLRHVFLCHLSKDNNTPQIALHTVEQALTNAGLTVGDGSGSPYSLRADLQLQALPRFESTGMIALR